MLGRIPSIWQCRLLSVVQRNSSRHEPPARVRLYCTYSPRDVKAVVSPTTFRHGSSWDEAAPRARCSGVGRVRPQVGGVSPKVLLTTGFNHYHHPDGRHRVRDNATVSPADRCTATRKCSEGPRIAVRHTIRALQCVGRFRWPHRVESLGETMAYLGSKRCPTIQHIQLD